MSAGNWKAAQLAQPAVSQHVAALERAMDLPLVERGTRPVQLLPRLDDGELDLAIIYEHEALPEVSSRQYDRVHLLDDTSRVVLPRGHRLARSGHDVSLAELADQTWVGGGPASTWFRIVRHTCRTAGFDPRVALTTDDNVAVQAFAAAGLASRSSRAWPSHPLPQVEVRSTREIRLHWVTSSDGLSDRVRLNRGSPSGSPLRTGWR